MQNAAIGRMALYKTFEGQDRPFIITRVWDDNLVNGRVILDGTNDSHIARSGTGILMGSDIHITSVARGQGIGQWRFYDD